jgi:hypothetical protein
MAAHAALEPAHMSRYARTVAWAVVGSLVVALVASLVLEGFA